jgi:hypothetical protein
MGGMWLREAGREKIWDLHWQGFNTNEMAPTVGGLLVGTCRQRQRASERGDLPSRGKRFRSLRG